MTRATIEAILSLRFVISRPLDNDKNAARVGARAAFNLMPNWVIEIAPNWQAHRHKDIAQAFDSDVV